MAFPRSSSSKEALMIASEPGTSIAPPTPCAARATISISGLVERPHHTEASVKTITPKEKMRRRPKWSPRDPPTRIRADKNRA
jgi:hypothetical protein